MIGYIGLSVSVFKALIKLALPTPYPYTSNGLTALNYFMTILYTENDHTYY